MENIEDIDAFTIIIPDLHTNLIHNKIKGLIKVKRNIYKKNCKFL